MHSYPSAEVFYTFAIAALISFLRKCEPEPLTAQLAYVGLGSNDLNPHGLEDVSNNRCGDPDIVGSFLVRVLDLEPGLSFGTCATSLPRRHRP